MKKFIKGDWKQCKNIWIKMILILLFGAIISAGIFAYGFFQIRKDFFDQTKQFSSSLNQIDQLVKIKNLSNCKTFR